VYFGTTFSTGATRRVFPSSQGLGVGQGLVSANIELDNYNKSAQKRRNHFSSAWNGNRDAASDLQEDRTLNATAAASCLLVPLKLTLASPQRDTKERHTGSQTLCRRTHSRVHQYGLQKRALVSRLPRKGTCRQLGLGATSAERLGKPGEPGKKMRPQTGNMSRRLLLFSPRLNFDYIPWG